MITGGGAITMGGGAITMGGGVGVASGGVGGASVARNIAPTEALGYLTASVGRGGAGVRTFGGRGIIFGTTGVIGWAETAGFTGGAT